MQDMNHDKVERVRVFGRLNRRRHTADREQLEREAPSQDLERITVQSVRPTEPDARVAADVTLYWPAEEGEDPEGLSFFGLNEGESVLIDAGAGDRLRLEKSGSTRIPWWLLAGILLVVLIWASVFIYLYFSA